jgi:hypothetical protein
MVKYVFYILVLTTTNIAAQNIDIESIEQIKVKNNNLTDLTLKFNKLNKIIKNNEEFVLEIQPINDCLKDLEGSTLFEPTFIDLKTNKSKEITVNYPMVKRKCFKWRIKTRLNKEILYSDWNFHSFVR